MKIVWLKVTSIPTLCAMGPYIPAEMKAAEQINVPKQQKQKQKQKIGVGAAHYITGREAQ